MHESTVGKQTDRRHRGWKAAFDCTLVCCQDYRRWRHSQSDQHCHQPEPHQPCAFCLAWPSLSCLCLSWRSVLWHDWSSVHPLWWRNEQDEVMLEWREFAFDLQELELRQRG